MTSPPDAAPAHQRLLEAIAAGVTDLLRTDSPEAADNLLERMARAILVQRAFVAEHVVAEDGRLRARVLHEWTAEGQESARLLFDGHQNPPESGHALFAALERDRCVILQRSQLPADLQARLAPTNIQSGLAVPIDVGGRCWGQLGLVDCQQERDWSVDDQATLRTLAAAIGLSIERRRAHEMLSRHLERVRDLHEAVATAPTSVREQIGRVLALASRHIDHEVAVVLNIRDEDVDSCEVLYAHGPPGGLGPGDRAPLARADFDHAVATRSPTAVPDFIASPARDHPIVAQYQMRSFIGVPVWVDEAPFGAVCFLSRHPREGSFTDADRDFVGLVGRWISSTLERETAETRRRALADRLRERQKLESLTVALGGLAHDFNNMLMVISTNLGIGRSSLAKGDMTEVQESLDQAKMAVDQAAELNRQMFTYAGRGRIERSRIDLRDLVDEMTVLLRTVLPRDVTILSRQEDDLPQLHADASQVRQILMNLIHNAADAMRDRGGTLWVRSGSTTFVEPPTAYIVGENAPRGAYAWIEVEDGGGGIAPDVQQCIFDPFFTTKPDGRGLGLAAVRGIVLRHRGCIDLESHPGVGTRFRVLLPLVDQD